MVLNCVSKYLVITKLYFCMNIGSYLLQHTGKAVSPEDGAQKLMRTLQDGSAMEHFQKMLIAQGVAPDTAKLVSNEQTMTQVLTPAKHITPLTAQTSGTSAHYYHTSIICH